MMADIRNEGTGNQVTSIVVEHPAAGETLTVAVTSGFHITLNFNLAAATFGVEGDDLILTLENGSQVVFEGLASAAQSGDVSIIRISGVDIAADLLVEQVLLLAAEAEAEPIETAAGDDAEAGDVEVEGGGRSSYDVSFGDLIAGLIQHGVIGETDLGIGQIGNGGAEFLVEPEFFPIAIS